MSREQLNDCAALSAKLEELLKTLVSARNQRCVKTNILNSQLYSDLGARQRCATCRSSRAPLESDCLVEVPMDTHFQNKLESAIETPYGQHIGVYPNKDGGGGLMTLQTRTPVSDSKMGRARFLVGVLVVQKPVGPLKQRVSETRISPVLATYCGALFWHPVLSFSF